MTLPPSGTETIGQRLRDARVAKGLSIEQAALATRIRVFYLQALEENNFSALPSPVQGRGFLRSYASYLGIELQPALPAVQEKETASETIPSTPTPNTEKQEFKPEIQEKPKAIPRKTFRQPKKKAEQEDLPPVSTHSNSQAIFADIGRILSQRRETLSMTLADIEKYTRLRLHYLKALESGKVDDLPSPVQGRGMLNNYALFLNLDADAILLKYADGLQARRIERLGEQAPHHPEARPAAYPALRRILSLDLIIGVLLVITLVVFLVWGISQVAAAQQKQVAKLTLPPVSQVLAVTDSLTPISTGSNASQSATPSPQGTSSSGLPAATLAITPLTTDAGPIQVYIVARQQAWLRVIVDGKIVFTGRVVPGNAYPFAGSQQVELITGSAAALQVFYNQTDVGALGLIGQVVDLVFTTNGMVLPTATLPPTPTKTIPVTPSKPGTQPTSLSQTPIVSGTPALSPTPAATKTPTPTQ